MDEKDKIQMHINIAGEHIPLTVGFSEQDHVREAERHVGELYDKWRQRFSKKSDKELLAMIAYQYASYYISLARRYEDAVNRIAEFDSELDSVVKN
jgi:hypothetical protein